MPRIVAVSIAAATTSCFPALPRCSKRRACASSASREVAPEILMPEGTLGALARHLSAITPTSPAALRCSPRWPVRYRPGGGRRRRPCRWRSKPPKAPTHADAGCAIAQRRTRSPRRAGVGVLVKAPKPQQDRRFDLPAIGPHTVEDVARAGLAGIRRRRRQRDRCRARQRCSAAADSARIFFVGVRRRRARERRASATAVDLSGRRGGIRRCAWRGARCARCALPPTGALTLAGVGGRAMAAEGVVSPFSHRRTRDRRRQRHPGAAAADLAAHPRNRGRRCRGAARRAGHHRQPGFHPSGGAPRARPRAVDSDRRLCLAFGLGLAVRPGARHARLCRLRAGDPAVRAGGAPAPRRAALHLCRPSAGRAPGRSAPEAREAERRRADPPLVLVLPGSRSSEIRLLLEVFGDAIARVSARVGAMELVLPTMPHLCRASAPA